MRKFIVALKERSLKEIPLKESYNSHIKSFRSEASNKETEHSKYIWLLKDSDETPTIKWRILKQISAKPKYNYCKLCLTEKLYNQFFCG